MPISFYLRKRSGDSKGGSTDGEDGSKDDGEKRELEESSNACKMLILAHATNTCLVWKWGDGGIGLDPHQGGDESYVAYVPCSVRHPPSFDLSKLLGNKVVAYDILEEDDDLCGTLYVGTH